MSGINKVTIMGRLGKDPETKYITDNRCVCNLSVATSDEWKDKATGEKKQRTEWHRVVLYDRLAEIAGQYLAKGNRVYIEGKLQTREWTDNEGIKRYVTEIIAQSMQFIDTNSGDKGRTSGPEYDPVATKNRQPDAPSFNDDDIPF